jgi:hypothetical protein
MTKNYSLRFLEMLKATLDGLSQANPALADEELREEIAAAARPSYSNSGNYAADLAAFSKAVEGIVATMPKPEQETAGEGVYRLLITFSNGERYGEAVHHVSLEDPEHMEIVASALAAGSHYADPAIENRETAFDWIEVSITTLAPETPILFASVENGNAVIHGERTVGAIVESVTSALKA